MIIDPKDRLLDIQRRWLDVDYDRWFWRRTATVRILMYADGGVKYDGGSFYGLQHVIQTLQSDPYPWVRFEITTAHRGYDPSADFDNVPVTNFDLESEFDEIWFFGIATGDILSSAEKAAVESFMDSADGGVLATGDHASLGRGLAGYIKRVGEMRAYPAPSAGGPDRLSSLREGPTAGFSFSDQSDYVPQDLTLKYYNSWSLYPFYRQSKYPHPVMCGPLGPIDVFPDHEHEGVATAPSSYGADWPTSSSGYQPEVELVAHATSIDPRFSGSFGDSWAVVGVYDGHRANVGRIVADATWHHWFDINLNGFYTPSAPAGTDDIIQQIEGYFLNVAIWLAGRSKQRQMRNAAWWNSLFVDPLIMFDTTRLRPAYLGGIARNALGQYAPQCMVRYWILDVYPFELRLEIERFLNNPKEEPLIAFPIEDITAGLVADMMIQQFNEDGRIPREYPGDKELDGMFRKAAEASINQFQSELSAFSERLSPITKFG